jgi:hypothetical protein
MKTKLIILTILVPNMLGAANKFGHKLGTNTGLDVRPFTLGDARCVATAKAYARLLDSDKSAVMPRSSIAHAGASSLLNSSPIRSVFKRARRQQTAHELLDNGAGYLDYVVLSTPGFLSERPLRPIPEGESLDFVVPPLNFMPIVSPRGGDDALLSRRRMSSARR